mgnify:CR=1 FL=1
MEIENLMKLGLTFGESRIYFSLVKCGPLSKVKLSSESGVSSSKIYEVSKKLVDKGLIGFFLKNNVQYFSSLDPSFLLDYVSRKEKEILEEKNLAFSLVSDLKKYSGHEGESYVEVFEGWKGVEAITSKVIEEVPDNFVIYGLGVELKREGILHKYHRKRINKKVKQKLIFPDTLSYRSKYKGNNIRFIKGITDIGLGIFSDKIILQDLGEEPFGVVIQNKNIRNSFKKIYDFLWEHSSKK